MVSIRKIKPLFFPLLFIILTGCQLGYIAQSAFYQAKMMRKRVPLKYALENYDLSPEQREKLKLAIDIRNFMKEELGLDTGSNYSRYVHLDRDYVTYAVNASPKDQLKTYKWHFPIIGSVPYKGYFKKEWAIEEANELKEKNLDTYVRGVSAYSTLGWFEDPLLSSMLRMDEHHFVSTLIHETVHANLYIEGESKFNERVATFLGQLGAEAYYEKLNRGDEIREILKNEAHDELLFSDFISKQLKDLREWYKDNKTNKKLIELREKKFKEMQAAFKKEVLPNLKTDNYKWFPDRELNNAFLLLLELYNSDFSDLETLANQYGREFKKVFNELKKLEDIENPEKALKNKLPQ